MKKKLLFAFYHPLHQSQFRPCTGCTIFRFYHHSMLFSDEKNAILILLIILSSFYLFILHSLLITHYSLLIPPPPSSFLHSSSYSRHWSFILPVSQNQYLWYRSGSTFNTDALSKQNWTNNFYPPVSRIWSEIGWFTAHKKKHKAALKQAGHFYMPCFSAPSRVAHYLTQ